MRDPAPPYAKIIRHPVYGKDSWVCYWCECFFCFTDFALAAREVTKCRRCQRFQVIGSSESVRTAAAAADQQQPTSSEEAAPSLPTNLDRGKLANIQQAYDRLKRNSGVEPSQVSVQKSSGHARSTVREYWPFLRR